MADLMKFVQDEFVTRKDFPAFGACDTITVFYEIKEGEKTRTQFFKGVVIQRRGSANTETFTIRKMSGAIGVERIFPVNLPALIKNEPYFQKFAFSKLKNHNSIIFKAKLNLIGTYSFLRKRFSYICNPK